MSPKGGHSAVGAPVSPHQQIWVKCGEKPGCLVASYLAWQEGLSSTVSELSDGGSNRTRS